MNISKKTKIIIAGIAAILLLAAVVLVAGNGGEPAIGNYDITGAWYSDREDGDTLTLEQDGYYTSSTWLAGGKYFVDGDTVTLTDVFGDSRTLTVTELDGASVLRHNSAVAPHTYYRTEQAVTAAREQKIAEEEALQSYYEDIVMQILTTGEWADAVGGPSEITAVFTEDSITVSSSGNEFVEAQTYNYSYTIVSVEASHGNFYVTFDLHGEIDFNGRKYNEDFKDCSMSIEYNEDNTYTLHSNSLPFTQKYTKTLDIEITLPEAAGNTNNSGT